MRGSLTQRSKGSWSIILDLGEQSDPTTGRKTRRQKWHTFRGTRKQAEAKLADLLKDVKDGAYVDASTLTLGDWLLEWLAAAKARFRPSTYVRYKGIIDRDLVPSDIGRMRLQHVRGAHLEAYYAAGTVSAATLALHHTILHSALRKAVKNSLIAKNVAVDLDNRPARRRDKSLNAQRQCWTASEAQTFLQVAQEAGPQPAAFYAFALDAGARKGEICGLAWEHLDLDGGTVSIVRQLLKPGPEPVFGPTKTGRPRTIALSAATVALLRAHRQQQREVKMANRTTYADHGLVFAKAWTDVQSRGASLGHPLQLNNLGQREYATLITAAGVKRITFHGLRHTCATLLLQARVPVHVVSERLGHAKVAMTMEVYAHVLPDMQRDAADVLGALLHQNVR